MLRQIRYRLVQPGCGELLGLLLALLTEILPTGGHAQRVIHAVCLIAAIVIVVGMFIWVVRPWGLERREDVPLVKFNPVTRDLEIYGPLPEHRVAASVQPTPGDGWAVIVETSVRIVKPSLGDRLFRRFPPAKTDSQ
jgi:hypothetical protein